MAPEEESYWIKKLESDLGDLGHLGISDVKTLLQMSIRTKNGEMIDDKQYLMEGLIKVFGPKSLGAISSSTSLSPSLTRSDHRTRPLPNFLKAP